MKTGARIGKVKFKSGGEVVLLKTAVRDGLSDKLVKDSVWIADCLPRNMDGFMVVAWDKDGAYSISRRVSGKGLGVTLATTFICETLRKELAAHDALELISEGYFD